MHTLPDLARHSVDPETARAAENPYFNSAHTGPFKETKRPLWHANDSPKINKNRRVPDDTQQFPDEKTEDKKEV